MKDRISERALVIKTEGGQARVRLVGGESCKRCGLAAIGLCKPGGTGMEFDVRNDLSAEAGEVVTLGIDPTARATGMAAAYGLPLGAFVLGALLAHVAGIPAWDVALAFIGLVCSLPFSHRILKDLDRVEHMRIERIVRGVPEFCPEAPASDEARRYLGAGQQLNPPME